MSSMEHERVLLKVSLWFLGIVVALTLVGKIKEYL